MIVCYCEFADYNSSNSRYVNVFGVSLALKNKKGRRTKKVHLLVKLWKSLFYFPFYTDTY